MPCLCETYWHFLHGKHESDALNHQMQYAMRNTSYATGRSQSVDHWDALQIVKFMIHWQQHAIPYKQLFSEYQLLDGEYGDSLV